MLDFKSISIKDKSAYDRFRLLDPTNGSEGVFATMFIWNEYYHLETAQDDEFFYIRFNIKGKAPAYFFPVGNGNLKIAIKKLEEYSRGRNEKLKFMLVSEENKNKLNELYPDKFSFESNRNCADYVYLTEKMISLSGKKLHSKKNHLNYFLQNYNFEYKSVETKELLDMCADKAYELINKKEKNTNSFELGAMERYFNNYFDLSQKGAVLMIDNEIAAMTFGEKLNENMALIQIELADDNFRGAYQAINKLFCEKEWSDLKYVNREEDMGIEGLRKAKLSYKPEMLIEKFIIEEK